MQKMQNLHILQNLEGYFHNSVYEAPKFQLWNAIIQIIRDID